MIRPPKSDFWQAGILRAPINTLLDARNAASWRTQVTWLPDPGPWRYLADPFGVRQGELMHIFVEAYDYRTKHAVIEHHEFGPDLAWRGKSVALAGPHHLSYPYIVQDGGAVFMIPESHRAGEIALYRAQEFPHKWVRETALLPGVNGAEATVIKHEDRWWMFFTIVGSGARDQRELHVAYADNLTGPWRLHAQNPVMNDRSGARPGGTPFVAQDGTLILPVQDCSRTYGGGIRFLRFNTLTPGYIAIERVGPTLTGDLFSETHGDGCHTLAHCGDCTLIDTKRTEHLWSRHKINVQRYLTRLGRSRHVRETHDT